MFLCWEMIKISLKENLNMVTEGKIVFLFLTDKIEIKKIKTRIKFCD